MAESGGGSHAAPVKKAPVKNAPVKKAPVKKAPVKNAPVKKAPVKKAPVKKAPVKKAPVKKAPVKKAPVKREGTRRAAALERARSAPMSKYFANARKRARKMIDDPEALKRVADEANSSGANRSGPFTAVLDDFHALIRLVVAYARGNYRDVRPASLVTVVAGLVYVVSPIDVIPDPIPVLGWSDDAVVIGWVIKSVRDELDAFRAWEVGQ